MKEIVHSPSAQCRIAERTDGMDPARHAVVRSHDIFSYTRLRLKGMRASVAAPTVVVHVTLKGPGKAVLSPPDVDGAFERCEMGAPARYERR